MLTLNLKIGLGVERNDLRSGHISKKRKKKISKTVIKKTKKLHFIMVPFVIVLRVRRRQRKLLIRTI